MAAFEFDEAEENLVWKHTGFTSIERCSAQIHYRASVIRVDKTVSDLLMEHSQFKKAENELA